MSHHLSQQQPMCQHYGAHLTPTRTLTITLSVPPPVMVHHLFHKPRLACLPSHLRILHRYYHLIHGHTILHVHHLIPHNIRHPCLRHSSILLKYQYIHYSSIHRNRQYDHLIFGNPLQCRTATFPNNHLRAIINIYLLYFMFRFTLFVT